MLILSIWMALTALAGTLMAADWYLWGPRYREPAAIGPERNLSQFRLPKAA